MAYYNVCPNCGSNLDPGESCDCKSLEQTERMKFDFTGGERGGTPVEAAGRELSRYGNTAVGMG